MSKADQLLKQHGDNMNESIGVAKKETGEVVHGEPPPDKPLKHKDKYQGRTTNRTAGVYEMEIERIVADPNQPRKDFDSAYMRNFADSVRELGVLQPISVRWCDEQGVWMIIDGESRWRAAKLAGLTSIPCVFQEDLADQGEILVRQLVSNCQRKDLRPLEQAHAFQSLIDITGWSKGELARRTPFSKSQIIKSLALLNLPQDIRDHVDNGHIAPSVAYEVSQVASESAQLKLAQQIIRRDLTRDQVIEKARQAAATSQNPKHKVPPKPTQYRLATNNARVTITVQHHNAKATQADIHDEILAAVDQLMELHNTTA